MSVSEFVEVIVIASAATANEPDEINDPIAKLSLASSMQFQSMQYVLIDYCEWQDCLTSDDLNMLCMLRAKVADVAAPKLKQACTTITRRVQTI